MSTEQNSEPLAADTRTPVERLHAAVQQFSNEISEEDADVGMVQQSVVSWEETSFDDGGNQSRRVLYAVTGDGATLAGSVGLASIAMKQIRDDVTTCRHE